MTPQNQRVFTCENGSSDFIVFLPKTIESVNDEIIVIHGSGDNGEFICNGFDTLKEFSDKYGPFCMVRQILFEMHDARSLEFLRISHASLEFLTLTSIVITVESTEEMMAYRIS